MEQVKQKSSIRILFSNLFGNNENIEYDVEITDNELLKAIESVDKEGKETEETIVTENKSSKNSGGFSSIKTERQVNKTLEKMRKNLQSQKDIVGKQERDDR